ncbi:YoaK family protein [Janibacter sp. G56]|uniref:YoaK family protein n=1 Tax=Janibacter sp. G56 TaxID=3418717 RepID=UPI003CFC0571
MSPPVDYLLAMAGPSRTPRTNRHLAYLLAFVAGLLNSVGFVAVSVYTSHMTGLTASVADQLVLGDRRLVVLGVLALVSFVGGAAVCAVLFNWARRRQLRSKFALVLLLEAALILAFGVLADLLRWEHRAYIFVGLLAFIMGLQNAIITKISDAQIRTTHVTGMVTDIGIELGKLSFRSRRDGLAPVVGDVAKLRMLSALVGLFFIGGVAGAAGYLWAGFTLLVLPAMALFLVSSGPLVDDVRHGRGGETVQRMATWAARREVD